MHRRPSTRLVLLALLISGLLAAPSLASGASAPGSSLSVRGTVLLPDGSPAVGARAELLPVLSLDQAGRRWLAGVGDSRSEPEPADGDRAGNDGRFILRAPSSGVWTVRVSAEGHQTMELLALGLVQDEELAPLVLVADRRIEGRLLDASGSAIAGAHVVLQGRDLRFRNLSRTTWTPADSSASTAADGSFVLRAGKEEARLVAYLGDSAPEDPPTSETVPARVWLEYGYAGGTVRLGKLEPRRVAVVDARDRPLGGALVSLEGSPWALGTTDEGGVLHWRQGSRGEPDDGMGNRRRRFALGLLEPFQWIHLTFEDGRRMLHRPAADDEPLEMPVAVPGEGRVLGEKGTTAEGDSITETLAGALVFWIQDPGSFVFTDGSGEYRLVPPVDLTGTVKRAATLAVRAAGYLSSVEEASAADQPELPTATPRLPTWRLKPAMSLAGEVVDPAGRPVTTASVEARISLSPRQLFTLGSSAPPVWTRVDGAGRFLLRGLAPGAGYLVRAVRSGSVGGADGGGAGRSVEVVLPRQGPADAVRIVLPPDRPAFGRVMDEEGRPVAGAEVVLGPAEGQGGAAANAAGRMSREARWRSAVRAATDGEGRFELAALPATTLDVRVQATGFAPLRVAGVEALIPEGSAVAAANLGTFIVSPGVAILGRVVDEDGAPVAGASIHPLHEGMNMGMSSARHRASLLSSLTGAAESGEDGRFAVEGLSPGDRKLLWVQAEGFLATSVGTVEAPTEAPVEVVLQRAARIEGLVEDEEGEAVVGVRLFAQWQEMGKDGKPTGEESGAQSETDAEGIFFVDVPPEGEITLKAWSASYLDPEPLVVEAPAATQAKSVRIVLQRGATLRGRVTTGSGQPVTKAQLIIGSSRGESDGEGRYRLEGLAQGKTLVALFHPVYGSLREEVEIRSGENTLDWTVEGGWQVSGRVVDPQGEPVAGAELELDGTRRRPFERVYSDGAGRFVFDQVAAGRYQLRAEHQAFAPAAREEPIVVEGGPVTGIEVALTTGATVSGQVRGLEPDQLSSVRIEASRPKGQNLRGQVRYDGAYEVHNLLPGSWTLVAHLDGRGRMAREPIFIEAGTVQLERDLVFGGVVLGGVVRQGREPVTGVQVLVQGVDFQAERWATTDPKGEFRIEDVDPGRYELAVGTSPLQLHHREVVDLTEDDWLEIELRPASVSGRVVDRAGEPIPQVFVLARPAGEPDRVLATTRTESDGRFALFRLPPGEHRLETRAVGHGSEWLDLDLAAGEDRTGVEIVLSPNAEVMLAPTVGGGGPPELLSMVVVDAAGRPVTALRRGADENGLVALQTVPAGSWTLLAGAPEAALTRIPLQVPSEAPIPVPLAPAGTLTVTVPELAETYLFATATLTGATGAPVQALDLSPPGPTSSFKLQFGTVTIPSVPAGQWTVTVEATDGRTWSGEVQTSGGTQAVELP
ncbi:MAG: carboxypeptidase-like regulatory domain-containing protein [Acidobacteriota bacterium]|nr:carboxypeptidase-like regulatory domain-containing protein [Acidobacteriota bacterium]